MVESSPNDRIIYRYLRYRIHDDGRETFFNGIDRLLPGEMMIVENGKKEFKLYSKKASTRPQAAARGSASETGGLRAVRGETSH